MFSITYLTVYISSINAHSLKPFSVVKAIVNPMLLWDFISIPDKDLKQIILVYFQWAQLLSYTVLLNF